MAACGGAGVAWSAVTVGAMSLSRIGRHLVIVVSVLVVAGCGSSGPAAKPRPTTAAPTPIEQLRTDSLHLVRAKFCEVIPASAVKRAIGDVGEPTDWGTGDTFTDAQGNEHVGDEFGCRWTTDTASASAWVFAQPVDQAMAKSVIRDARTTPGCRTTRVGSFGSPTLTQRCRLDDTTSRVRHAGLIGDTWLTCEVTGPDEPTLADRSAAWCVEIAQALDTSK